MLYPVVSLHIRSSQNYNPYNKLNLAEETEVWPWAYRRAGARDILLSRCDAKSKQANILTSQNQGLRFPREVAWLRFTESIYSLCVREGMTRMNHETNDSL